MKFQNAVIKILAIHLQLHRAATKTIQLCWVQMGWQLNGTNAATPEILMYYAFA